MSCQQHEEASHEESSSEDSNIKRELTYRNDSKCAHCEAWIGVRPTCHKCQRDAAPAPPFYYTLPSLSKSSKMVTDRTYIGRAVRWNAPQLREHHQERIICAVFFPTDQLHELHRQFQSTNAMARWPKMVDDLVRNFDHGTFDQLKASVKQAVEGKLPTPPIGEPIEKISAPIVLTLKEEQEASEAVTRKATELIGEIIDVLQQEYKKRRITRADDAPNGEN